MRTVLLLEVYSLLLHTPPSTISKSVEQVESSPSTRLRASRCLDSTFSNTALSRFLCLLLVDDEAELTNDRLCEEQVAGHVFLRVSDEKEVVEVADIGDALLG